MTPGSNPRLRDSSVRLHHRAVVVAAMGGDSGGPFSSSGNGGSGGYNSSFGNNNDASGGMDSAGGSNSKRLGSLVRQLSIDQFENEARRIGTPEFGNGGGTNSPGYANGGTPQRFAREQRASNLGHVPAHKTVLSALLNPTSWEAPPNRAFFMNAAQIDELCDAAEAVFKSENTVEITSSSH